MEHESEWLRQTREALVPCCTYNARLGRGVDGPRLGLDSGVHAPDIGVQVPDDGSCGGGVIMSGAHSDG